MKHLFQHSRFFNLKIAFSLVVLFLALVLGAVFCLPWHQKYNASVAIITSEGDESVLDDIILDGIISKNGYQTSFSVTGQWLAMNTETLELTQQTSWQNWSNQLNAFRNDLLYEGYGINEMNRTYAVAEGATATLLASEAEDTQDADIWQEDDVTINENLFAVDFAVPAFCFVEGADVYTYGYSYGGTNMMAADYTIPAQEEGWQMEYSQRAYTYGDGQTELDDPSWKNITVPNDYTATNFSQLSASIGGEDYITLPTLVGAVGQNGIYRVTPTATEHYIWRGQLVDLREASICADYMAQRKAVYLYDIQTEGAADCITCGMIAHKDTLFLLTAQIEDATQITTLTLTAINPAGGAVLDTIVLGSYALQEECPPMLYQNENYLSVGIAIASGANEIHPEYAGFTVLSFAFDAAQGDATAQAQTSEDAQANTTRKTDAQADMHSETGALQLCDRTTFIKSAFGDESCLQDVYFDGDTLFLMETSNYYVGDDFDPHTIYNVTFLGRYLTQRLMAFQGGDCVWQGYLSTDVYQDYLRDSYGSWSRERVVSNLKFHQESEERA